jgi:hypothetical protein
MEMGLTESAGGKVDRAPGADVAAPAAEAVTGGAAGLSGKEAQASVMSVIARPAREMGLAMGVRRDYSIASS